jgi:hypothetical protein
MVSDYPVGVSVDKAHPKMGTRVVPKCCPTEKQKLLELTHRVGILETPVSLKHFRHISSDVGIIFLSISV